MKLKLILLAGLFAFGYAASATAGSVADVDGDGVPDVFDNCSTIANGMNEPDINQLDSDMDGFGNICDPDYDNDGLVTATDFGIFLSAFPSPPVTFNPDVDHDGSGDITAADFGTFIAFFPSPGVPGPSGLSCAGTIPCKP